ncbi:UbiD family decarboxylase [Agromyces sp. SYSU T00194]|uniref:UbiD family decarboxylase n=1 Tax=Agromyces chitinivorans TaxID=3158560 RepID=UPI003394DEED
MTDTLTTHSMPGRGDAEAVPFDDRGDAPTGLRRWLAEMDRLGELRVVEGVDAEASIGHVSEMLHHTEDSPAVLFDRIPGYEPGWRVLVNSLGNRARLAATLGLPADIGTFALCDAWGRHLDEAVPLPTEEVAEGPITENVMTGDDIDLWKFPTPLWHPEDGGPYIGTGCGIITRGRDDGIVNMGAYRVQVHDERTTGLYISPGKHGRLHRDGYFDNGEDMPAVIVAGLDPLQFMASGLEIPNGVNELEWVGGVQGSPIPTITGRFTGLPIPADAEIAIEGFLRHDKERIEGPFGEWTGYYASTARPEPVFEVSAVYYRNNPIILGCPPEKPPYEAQRFQQYGRSANLKREITAAGIPGVTAAWTHSVGGCRLFNVIAISQKYQGHSRQVGTVAAQVRQANYLGRIVVVVDDDIDITDLHEVIWAVSTRADPERDTIILTGALSGHLDPAIHPDRKGTNSRMIIDATRPYEWRDRFPPAIGPSTEVKQYTRDTWSWILG